MKEKRNKIIVSFYEEDLEKVGTMIKADVSSRNIRTYFGLNPTGKIKGQNALIRTALNDVLKTASEEKKQKLLEEFGFSEQAEKQAKKIKIK